MSARSPEWRKARGVIQRRAKELGLDDDARRALQRRVTGKESCADMSVAELRRVAAAMKRGAEGRRPDRDTRKDWTGRPGRRDRAAREARSVARPRAQSARSSGASARRLRDEESGRPPGAHELDAKLLALWISGWHLGVVRDRTDAGLTAWLRRRFGIEVPRWPDFPAKARAVEGLKAWLAREAQVDWRAHRAIGRDGREHEMDRPQARVLEAQWRILCEAGVFESDSLAALGAYACRHARIGCADSHLALNGRQTIALMQDFGARVRKAKAAASPEPAA